ncbi:hypothetical protein QTJ16_003921 [Diplocarpon rosae]|uniref:Transcription factor CBF/NF-Y/archaeal histone domain-containing protein n=1 Tax=Diplocarpon rosae TaxID=946125 RepID=A0AAD9WEW9_9HELO|nr:hypothetical protein QTJ16_003921 [Diplocarpon rosae]
MSASPKETDHEAGVQSPDDPDAVMNDPHNAGLAFEFEVKEQDRWLPIANVARIMKTALPENAKIAKEAKECMQECVSEFISFITSEASEKCHQEKRKTVNGEDILFAMTSLGFENYAEALKIYLSKYRETQSSRSEQRPGSQGGFGSAIAGSSGSVNAAPTAFQGGADGSNNILGGQQGEGGDHDANSYGNLYGQVTSRHNGSAGESY